MLPLALREYPPGAPQALLLEGPQAQPQAAPPAEMFLPALRVQPQEVPRAPREQWASPSPRSKPPHSTLPGPAQRAEPHEASPSSAPFPLASVRCAQKGSQSTGLDTHDHPHCKSSRLSERAHSHEGSRAVDAPVCGQKKSSHYAQNATCRGTDAPLHSRFASSRAHLGRSSSMTRLQTHLSRPRIGPTRLRIAASCHFDFFPG